MKLRTAGPARASQSKREPRDELLAFATALAGKPQQLATASGQDLLHRPLHDPRREIQVLGDLLAPQPARVKRDHRALPTGEAAEDHARESLEFVLVLSLDQLVSGV